MDVLDGQRVDADDAPDERQQREIHAQGADLRERGAVELGEPHVVQHELAEHAARDLADRGAARELLVQGRDHAVPHQPTAPRGVEDDHEHHVEHDEQGEEPAEHPQDPAHDPPTPRQHQYASPTATYQPRFS